MTRLGQTAQRARRPVLRLAGVVRKFDSAEGAGLTVLDGANLDIFPGEMVALVAPSGTGKSTLLQIAGLLEHPSAGEVFIAGRPDQPARRPRPHDASAASPSASSISSTTCCRNSRRWKT